MKLAFSTLGCPEWDLPTIVAKAQSMGYGGVEFRGLLGYLDLPELVEFGAKIDETKKRFEDAGIEVAALGASASLCHQGRKSRAAAVGEARRYVELAAKLKCRTVRLMAGDPPRGAGRSETLSGIAEALNELSPFAAEHGCQVAIDNAGEFSSSRDLWYVMDAVSHPGCGLCWDLCHGYVNGERPTHSIPRIGRFISHVHVKDAKFDADGFVDKYLPLGEGEVEIERAIELLKGIGFDGWLSVRWEKLWNPGLADPDKVLPNAVKYLRSILEAKPAKMTVR
jgi:sugar phosphate isomerase/epimerase